MSLKLDNTDYDRLIKTLVGMSQFLTETGRVSLVNAAVKGSSIEEKIWSNLNLSGNVGSAARGLVDELCQMGRISPNQEALDLLVRYLIDNIFGAADENTIFLKELIKRYYLEQPRPAGLGSEFPLIKENPSWANLAKWGIGLLILVGLGFVMVLSFTNIFGKGQTRPTDTRPISPTILPTITPTRAVQLGTSIIALQNINRVKATISYQSIQFTNINNSKNQEVEPGRTLLIDVTKDGVVPSGQSSAIISSDQKLYAITFMEAGYLNDPGAKLRLSYSNEEINAPSNTLYFPEVKNGYAGVYSKYMIQNSGSKPASFHAKITMMDGAVYSYTSPTLIVGESILIKPSDLGIPEREDERGSLVITADEPFSGNVVEYEKGGEELNSTNATGFENAYDQAYIAERNLGNAAAVYVINADTKPIGLSVYYMSNCGDQVFSTGIGDILPGASKIFNPPAGKVESGCRPWALIKGNGKFIAYASETLSPGQSKRWTTYPALPAQTVTKTLAAPYFANKRDEINSLLQVRNINSTTMTNITATFRCTDAKGGSFEMKTRPIPIAANDYYEFRDISKMAGVFEKDPAVFVGSWCSVIVEGDQKIIGFVSESSDNARITTTVSYNAFNFDY